MMPADGSLERCVGCMAVPASVKLGAGCMCRPMWCLGCIGKWFASQQDQDAQGTWLAGNAACPTCRSVFTVADIAPVVPPRGGPDTSA